MMPGQHVVPGRTARARSRNMRVSRDRAWDRGRDDRLAGRAPANPYAAGSDNADSYDAAYRLTKPPRTRPMPAARRMPGTRPQSLAQLAGTLCNLLEFQLWLGVASPEDAAVIVRARCGIQSRRELDTNPAAAALFHDRIRRPFAVSRES